MTGGPPGHPPAEPPGSLPPSIRVVGALSPRFSRGSPIHPHALTRTPPPIPHYHSADMTGPPTRPSPQGRPEGAVGDRSPTLTLSLTPREGRRGGFLPLEGVSENGSYRNRELTKFYPFTPTHPHIGKGLNPCLYYTPVWPWR